MGEHAETSKRRHDAAPDLKKKTSSPSPSETIPDIPRADIPLTTGQLLYLQRTVGNRAVQSLLRSSNGLASSATRLQRAPTHEAESDEGGDIVVMEAPDHHPAPASSHEANGRVQRAPENGELDDDSGEMETGDLDDAGFTVEPGGVISGAANGANGGNPSRAGMQVTVLSRSPYAGQRMTLQRLVAAHPDRRITVLRSPSSRSGDHTVRRKPASAERSDHAPALAPQPQVPVISTMQRVPEIQRAGIGAKITYTALNFISEQAIGPLTDLKHAIRLGWYHLRNPPDKTAKIDKLKGRLKDEWVGDYGPAGNWMHGVHFASTLAEKLGALSGAIGFLATLASIAAPPAAAVATVCGIIGVVFAGISFILRSILTVASIYKYHKTGDVNYKKAAISNGLSALASLLGVVTFGITAGMNKPSLEHKLADMGTLTEGLIGGSGGLVGKYAQMGGEIGTKDMGGSPPTTTPPSPPSSSPPSTPPPPTPTSPTPTTSHTPPNKPLPPLPTPPTPPSPTPTTSHTPPNKPLPPLPTPPTPPSPTPPSPSHTPPNKPLPPIPQQGVTPKRDESLIRREGEDDDKSYNDSEIIVDINNTLTELEQQVPGHKSQVEEEKRDFAENRSVADKTQSKLEDATGKSDDLSSKTETMNNKVSEAEDELVEPTLDDAKATNPKEVDELEEKVTQAERVADSESGLQTPEVQTVTQKKGFFARLKERVKKGITFFKRGAQKLFGRLSSVFARFKAVMTKLKNKVVQFVVKTAGLQKDLMAAQTDLDYSAAEDRYNAQTVEERGAEVDKISETLGKF